MSLSLSFSLGSLDPSFHPTETQGGAGLRWRGWGSQDWAWRRKQRESRQHQGNLDWWPAQRKDWRGKGKGAEEWARAQQLSLRGDRCFLIGVFEALTHPGDLLAPRHF